MKIRYYSHASYQIITASGKRLLGDPWVYNPISNNLWQFPECPIDPETYVDQDYLYISHNHVDHYCVDTLKHFRRDIPIIMRKYGELNNPMKPTLKKMGFENFVEIDHRETVKIADDLTISLYADLATTDSAIVIQDGENILFNQNDCMLSDEDAAHIGQSFDVDLALLGLPNSSIYPTFFEMAPDVKMEIAKQIAQKILRRTCNYGVLSGAKVVVPCASDMVFLSLPETDKYIGPTIIDVPGFAKENKLPFRVLTPAPGDYIDLNDMPDHLKPIYTNTEEMNNQIRALRNREDVRAVFAGVHEWMGQFVFDKDAFDRLIFRYLNHVQDNFEEIFSLALDKVADTELYRVILAIKDGEDKYGYELSFNFKDHKASARHVPYTLDADEHTDMILEMDAWGVQSVIEGALSFEDIRGGSMNMRRPGSFCTEEMMFWDTLLLFRVWLDNNDLAVKRENVSPRRISSVFS